MNKKKMSKSIRKHIRLQKKNICKQCANEKEQQEKISALYNKFSEKKEK